MEPDTEGGICHPQHPAVSGLRELFDPAFRRNGAGPFIGRRVPALYRAAGLVEVGVEARATVYPPAELDLTARQHLEDPETLALPHLSFLVWGRRAG